MQSLFFELLAQDGWFRGSILIHEASGEPTVKMLAGTEHDLGSKQFPFSVSGVADFAVGQESSVLASMSNRSFFFHLGEGSFSIERFEQLLPEVGVWGDAEGEIGQSRMIINLRGGLFFGDSRSLGEFSQCFVETPLGRLNVSPGLWYMRINFEQRSHIFDFMLYCREGRLRFTDLQGRRYTLYAGQRLAGAGARSAPSVEVGEAMEINRELMTAFLSKVQTLSEDGIELEQYLDALVAIDDDRGLGVPTSPVLSGDQSHPIVIDYAPDPDWVTPFRGELRPPSVDQADIF